MPNGAYMGGGSFYDPWGHLAGIPNISEQFPSTPVPQTALPVYTPPAAPVVEPVWFDPQAPLDTPDPFEAWPSPLLQPPETELAFIPDAAWIPELQPTLQVPGLEEKFGGYPIQPTVYEPGVAYEIPEPGGPLEFVGDVIGFAGDVVKTGLDVVWDTGKFILEHLDVGLSYAGQIGGAVSQKKYYEQLGEAQKTAAEAAEIRAKAYAELVTQGKMSQEEAIARGMAFGMESQKGLTAGQPVIYETPAAKQLSDYLPLAIAAIAAIIVFKKGKI